MLHTVINHHKKKRNRKYNRLFQQRYIRRSKYRAYSLNLYQTPIRTEYNMVILCSNWHITYIIALITIVISYTEWARSN